MMVSPFNAKLSNVWSDGRKSERNCGDEATQFGRREPEDSGSFKRKVVSLLVALQVRIWS